MSPRPPPGRSSSRGEVPVLARSGTSRVCSDPALRPLRQHNHSDVGPGHGSSNASAGADVAIRRGKVPPWNCACPCCSRAGPSPGSCRSHHGACPGVRRDARDEAKTKGIDQTPIGSSFRLLTCPNQICRIPRRCRTRIPAGLPGLLASHLNWCPKPSCGSRRMSRRRSREARLGRCQPHTAVRIGPTATSTAANVQCRSISALSRSGRSR